MVKRLKKEEKEEEIPKKTPQKKKIYDLDDVKKENKENERKKLFKDERNAEKRGTAGKKFRKKIPRKRKGKFTSWMMFKKKTKITNGKTLKK